jgi:hypothetical protein
LLCSPGSGLAGAGPGGHVLVRTILRVTGNKYRDVRVTGTVQVADSDQIGLWTFKFTEPEFRGGTGMLDRELRRNAGPPTQSQPGRAHLGPRPPAGCQVSVNEFSPCPPHGAADTELRSPLARDCDVTRMPAAAAAQVPAGRVPVTSDSKTWRPPPAAARARPTGGPGRMVTVPGPGR